MDGDLARPRGDAWVRIVTAQHFVTAAVRTGSNARRVTIMDCRSEAPMSEEAGYRRQAFLTYGQQVLVLYPERRRMPVRSPARLMR